VTVIAEPDRRPAITRSRKPEAWTGTVLAAGPYNDRLGLTARQRADIHQRLAEVGVRRLPFPFASAVAILSDVDSSHPERYAGYVGMLVDQLGLDFGDSTWLASAVSAAGQPFGLGFFSPRMTLGSDAPLADLGPVRTLVEAVAQHHLGNIDHFHAFLPNGPRVAILQKVSTPRPELLEVRPGRLQMIGPHHCNGFFVFGICVVAKPGRALDITDVAIRLKSGAVVSGFTRTDPAGEVDSHPFVLQSGPDGEVQAPELTQVDCIEVWLRHPVRRQDVDRVMLTNTHGGLMLDRLALLRDRYNVEMGLVTEHASLHFRNPPRQNDRDASLARHVKVSSDLVEAFNGRLEDERGGLIFSTDADDPQSVARVLPDLCRELSVRMIVPKASARASGWDPLEMLSPSPTRSGGGFYWAQRTLPIIDTPMEGRAADSPSRHGSFTRRLQRALADASAGPGQFWPIYTHLGGLEGLRRSAPATVPVPYFEPGPLLDLQDRVFNISGRAAASDRVWFTRGSVMYDYALLLRQIGSQITRPDANTVHIRSWRDPLLRTRLPLSASQLYGMTFYVDDAEAGRVELDGKPVEFLIRNGPDETGRPSVTVADCGIRHTVFERLDPALRAAAEASLQNGRWTWRARGEGRLTAGRRAILPMPRRVLARMTIPLHGWAPTGAQVFAFDVRSDKAARFGLVFETVSGGRFFFGDPDVADEETGLTATAFVAAPRPGLKLRTIAVGLHTLVWSSTARPGGPLPTHPLASVTLLCQAPRGRGVDFARLVFLRPRATSLRAHANGFSVIGRIDPAAGVHGVRLQRVRGADEPVRTAGLDARGFFHFEGVRPGVYRIWAHAISTDLVDRRGLLVEVGSDIADLVLSRPCARVQAVGAGPVEA
jgi:hypothetical protein